MPNITPTVGRVVHYYPDRANDKNIGVGPLAAVVAAVNNDGTYINLGVFTAMGACVSRQSVPMLQPDDPLPEVGGYACWMPYQTEQAQKTEEVMQMFPGPVVQINGTSIFNPPELSPRDDTKEAPVT